MAAAPVRALTAGFPMNCSTWRKFAAGFSLCLILGAAGCSRDEVVRASVEGNVTFDGKPVESGMILFIPEPGVVGPPVQVMIENGKYASSESTGPTVGQNAVQIIAVRKTGRILKIEGQDSAEEVQYIPKKYNEQSTEKVEIQSGENHFDYELKS
jgi:hypothetical protein